MCNCIHTMLIHVVRIDTYSSNDTAEFPDNIHHVRDLCASMSEMIF